MLKQNGKRVDSIQAVWEAYHVAMQKAGLDNATPLYVASGLLTYGGRQGVHFPEKLSQNAHSLCATFPPTSRANQMRKTDAGVCRDAAGRSISHKASLTKMNFCSCVHTKEMYLQQGVIDGKPLFHASSNKCS